MKTCTTCGQSLPLTDFYSSKLGKGGLRSACKECSKASVIAWRAKEGNAERHRETTKRSYHRAGWSRVVFKRYGLTQEQYDTLYEEQQGRCAICGEPEGGVTSQGATRRIAVDHDGEGETLRVRGLLCAGCNTGLGAFDHDPERMERAAAYLEEFLD
ncbi:endonuclease VII domain-containing protein [Sphaerisporangium sp. NPDC049002]|uniref:endonuclease VII domain-containing protein n=1 Tax=Sphaerisporangium sp. NPDC049002 TaxID=3155392 RepID=UPI0034043C82